MNYPSGFPGTAAVQNTAFIDQNCPSTWNAPPNMPPAWEPASYVNSTVSIVTVSLCVLLQSLPCVFLSFPYQLLACSS